MSKKNLTPAVLSSPDVVVDEIIGDLTEAKLSPDEIDFVMALLTTKNITEAGKVVGFTQQRAKRTKKRLQPLLQKIYPKLQRRSLTILSIAAPEAAQALYTLLKDLKDSKTDTKRKTAEAILDRVTGKPVARVAVKQQTDKEVKVQFKGWQPPIVPVGSSDSDKKKKEENDL